MPRSVRIAHPYKGHLPGAVVSLPDDEARSLVGAGMVTFADGASPTPLPLGSRLLSLSYTGQLTHTAGTAALPVPGLNGTFSKGARPITAKFGGLVRSASVGALPTLVLEVDGVQVDATAATISTANGFACIAREIDLDMPNALAPGQHTVRLLLTDLGVGSAILKCDAGARSYLRLIEE